MNRERCFDVVVPSDLLSTLILAAHSASEWAGLDRRWQYGNVTAIGRPRIYELDTQTARQRYAVAGQLLAAITVAVESNVAADVLFVVDASRAIARFVAPRAAEEEEAANRQASWTQFLAGETCTELSGEGVRAVLQQSPWTSL